MGQGLSHEMGSRGVDVFRRQIQQDVIVGCSRQERKEVRVRSWGLGVMGPAGVSGRSTCLGEGTRAGLRAKSHLFAPCHLLPQFPQVPAMSELDTGARPLATGPMPPTSALGVPCGDSGRSDREDNFLGWGSGRGCVV